MSDRILKILLSACLTLCATLLAAQVHSIAVDIHTIAQPPGTVAKPSNWDTLPFCPSEDSAGDFNCKWDASVQGNGKGVSFFSREGQIYYVAR
jgi:hypothetical protein